MGRPRKIAVFTMDLEDFADTGCVYNSGVEVRQDMLDGVDEYIALLDRYGIKATLFAMCEAAEKVQDKLNSYIDRGHSLALHGYDHTAPMLISYEDFRQKTAAAKQRLEELFGVKVQGYRAPFFSLDNQRLDILTELGFQYDSSRFDFPKRDHAGYIDVSSFQQLGDNVFRRGGFYEFGMPCQQWMGLRVPVSGGGYARLGNWTFFLSVLYQYLMHNNYYVFYLHPFELSKEKMPHIPNLRKRDRYYLHAGTHGYRHKVEAIIRILQKLGYEFVTFDQLAEQLEQQGERVFQS